MLNFDAGLEIHKPTDFERQIETVVTNGVGYFPSFHSEESVLAVQTELGDLDVRQGNSDAKRAVELMHGMMVSNTYIRRGWTAGGIHVYTEANDPEELARLVNGVVALERRNPLPSLTGFELGIFKRGSDRSGLPKQTERSKFSFSKKLKLIIPN